MNVPIQPVDSAEVARALLDLSTTSATGNRQLAGPRAERLVDLARARHHADLEDLAPSLRSRWVPPPSLEVVAVPLGADPEAPSGLPRVRTLQRAVVDP